jgi:hypothetical protein
VLCVKQSAFFVVILMNENYVLMNCKPKNDEPAFNPLVSVFHFYIEGFKNMKQGKTLWAIILIKLFVIFVILKMLFFPNLLNERYNNDKDKGNHVLEELTNRR